jgi:hypothetical protein
MSGFFLITFMWLSAYISCKSPQRNRINIFNVIPRITVTPVFYLKHMVDNVRTSQETHYVSAAEPNPSMRPVRLSEPHWKDITSPLRAQQVNAIYRSVTLVILI